MRKKWIWCCDMTITESNMVFGDFPPEQLFHAEKSPVYENQLKDNSVRSTEFWLLRNGNLLMVEAKTSTPDFEHAAATEEKRQKCEEFRQEIVEKFLHSLMMYFSMRSGRITNELPDTFQEQDCAEVSFALILVVKTGHPRSLKNLRRILEEELSAVLSTPAMKALWHIDLNKVFVINEQMAISRSLVLPPDSTT